MAEADIGRICIGSASARLTEKAQMVEAHVC